MNTTIVEPFNPEMMCDEFSQNLRENHQAERRHGWIPCLRCIEINPPTQKYNAIIVDSKGEPILLDGRSKIFRKSTYLEVGDKVYKHFRPQSPGIIYRTFAVETWSSDGKRFFGIHQMLQVRWLPNAKEKKKKIPFSESYEHSEDVSTLLGLIADHRRKLKKHEDNAKLLDVIV